MTDIRPMWSTTVHPSEYDIDEQMTEFVKAANKAKEHYYGIDVGKLWGLYTAYKSQQDELATLRAQLEEAKRVIEPFASESDMWASKTPDTETPIIKGSDGKGDEAAFTVGDLRAAAAWYQKVTTA